MINSSSKRLLLILGSLSMALGVIFVYVTLLSPSYKEVQLLRGERESKLGIVKNTVEIEAKVKVLLEKYRGLSKVEEVFSQILPSTPELPSILNQLDGISRINGVAIDSTSFNLSALKSSSGLIKPIGTVRISLVLSGKYEAIKSFIKDIETNIRLMDVSAFRVDGGAVSGKDVLSYNLEIDAYYQSE